MRRREFITLLVRAAAAWPLTARAQQPPVIGYLSSFPADMNPKFTQAFRQGLNDAGFFEGRNVIIEYRWDEEGRYDRLPMMGSRSRWPASGRALREPNSCGTRGQGGDRHDSNRVCDRQRPRRDRLDCLSA